MNGVLIPRRELFINGTWVEPVKGGRMDVIDPATEEVIGSIPAGTAEDIDQAVHCATVAFKSGPWSNSTGAYRAKYLRAFSEKIKERKEYLAKLETSDCGKPIDEALWDMDDVAGCLTYYAGLAEKLDEQPFKEIDVGMEEFKVKVCRGPIGVVALITPWNYPLLMAVWKIAPALAAGCCCVLKPSELASVTSLELASLASEIGLPEGVLNVVTGTGTAAGAPLSGHPGVAKVAFTGSVATGRAVAIAAAANVRPCSLELGGKSAAIVFADADLDKAVEWIMFGCFWTSGQICSATSRLIVEKSVQEEFLRKLKQRAESIPVRDPLTPGGRLGPVVNRTQYEKVLSYIAAGVADGGVVVTGGSRPPALVLGGGIGGGSGDGAKGSDSGSEIPDRTARIRESGSGFFIAPTVIVVDGSTGACNGGAAVGSSSSPSSSSPSSSGGLNRFWV